MIIPPDKYATGEELLEAVFSVRSVPSLYKEDQLPLRMSRDRVCKQTLSRELRLVTEAGDSSGTQSKRNVQSWKPLPSNAVKTVERTLVCV
jgi:hypothetical protein